MHHQQSLFTLTGVNDESWMALKDLESPVLVFVNRPIARKYMWGKKKKIDI